MKLRWVGWLSPIIGLAAAVALIQPGCTDNSCTPSSGDNNTPGPAFECAAGEVCYLGQCIKTCSAGAELVERCASDNDCSGSRPSCVRNFCSSCSDDEACVPTLNICQPVSEVILPDAIDRPDLPQTVPRPLDAGFAPGGIARPGGDAGVAEQPEDSEVTRAAFVDIGRQVNLRSDPATESPVASVRVFDTAIGAGNGLKWRVELDPPQVEVAFLDPSEPGAPQNTIDEFCELRMLQTATGTTGATATPADLGTIRVLNSADFPDSITPQLTARFSANSYVLDEAPTDPSFLRFSVVEPTAPQFILVTGPTVSGVVARAWPEGSDFGHHVPFELIPTDATRTAMQAGFQVADPATEDLAFRYDRIETGNDGFEAVYVRITGEQTELFCEQREGPGLGGAIFVRAAILDAFRLAEGLNGPQTYNLYFERASRELLQPVGAPGQLVLVSIRVRHTLRTTVTF